MKGMTLIATAYDPEYRVTVRPVEDSTTHWLLLKVERKRGGVWTNHYKPLGDGALIRPDRNERVTDETPRPALWSTWMEIASHQLWRYLDKTRGDNHA
jgi:hypothetical protein